MILPREVRVGGVEVDISSFDFSDHSSNVPSVKTANAILIVLVSCFVGLRVFVRLFIVRKIFLDDILILAAAVFTITLAAVCIAATNHGLGTHVWLLPPADAFDIAKSCIQYLFVCQVFYACAIAFTKIAIIASYLRFVADGKFRMAMWATSFVIIGLWFTGVFVTIFQCTPVTGAWDFTNTDKKCLNYIKYLYASSSLTVATDIVLCIVPWPYLWRLHMPLKQRIILCLLFGGGAGACVASIVRISKLHTLQSMDITYQCVPCLNLSVIECSLGIICVSIPPLRPLAARLFPQSLRSKGSSSGKSPLGSLSFSKRSGPSNRDSRNQLEHGRNANTYGEESSEELTSLGQTTTAAACSPTDEEKMNEESRPSREDDS
ncbi:hypothetical protein BS50DRAFT_504244 [Corynespora cassiicola Philippines]|uniref:Rhodopsin domain-containing protein n=1 Tax=Corynespora cassiicola Philippines TaxID=1448308 RepID=A0A2T2N7R1_CORCC|nr:hypothetical protein BS50DRAFT_504244 [Corynespora cassiicola Philippines]